MPDIDSPAPTCFISYCWEDENHKAWVRDLAAQLRADGIDVRLDQWELAPGNKMPLFMERAVRDNQYVLIICTPTYKERSDGRIGGVGYEGDIMTAEALSGGPERKFIPVLRRGTWPESAPTWLAGKWGITLSFEPTDPRYVVQYADLMVTLRGNRPTAPPLRTSGEARSESAPRIGDATTPEAADAPIRITGIVVDRVTTPPMDGTRGSALYRVPFRLSRHPSSEWQDVFLQTWDHPPQWTGMHRPGTASVEGDVVWLNRTTLDEVQRYHRDTLLLVVAKTNEIVADWRAKQRRREQAERERQAEHHADVSRKAADITFDD